MNSKVLSYVLCIMPLVISIVSNAAEFRIPVELSPEIAQKRTPITLINATDYTIFIDIFTHSKEYESWRKYHISKDHSRREIRPYSSGTINTVTGFGPYAVQAIRLKDSSNPLEYFEIPTIPSHTEIQVDESPKGSGNLQVWYRSPQTKEQSRQEALAVMVATHKRTGAEAFPLGGESGQQEIYKQIAEYLLNGWQKTNKITRTAVFKNYLSGL